MFNNIKNSIVQQIRKLDTISGTVCKYEYQRPTKYISYGEADQIVLG